MRIWCTLILLAISISAISQIDQKTADKLIYYYKYPSSETIAEIAKERKNATGKIVDLIASSQGLPGQSDLDTIILLMDLKYNFLYFTEGKPIKFAECQNFAICDLSKKVGLPIPKGYVFIKTDVLADLEKLGQSDAPQTEGYTLYSRYILLKKSIEFSKTGVAESDPTNVLAHELVHAYINSNLEGKYDDLPKWFTEGAALYFAKNVPKKLIDQTIQTENYSKLTVDYIRYLNTFRYLSHIRGKKKFYRFVRESVMTGSVEKPLDDLFGRPTESYLIEEQASVWHTWRFYTFCFLVPIFVILVVIHWFRWSHLRLRYGHWLYIKTYGEKSYFLRISKDFYRRNRIGEFSIKEIYLYKATWVILALIAVGVWFLPYFRSFF